MRFEWFHDLQPGQRIKAAEHRPSVYCSFDGTGHVDDNATQAFPDPSDNLWGCSLLLFINIFMKAFSILVTQDLIRLIFPVLKLFIKLAA